MKFLKTNSKQTNKISKRHEIFFFPNYLKTYFSSGVDKVAAFLPLAVAGNISVPALFLFNSLLSTSGRGNL